MPGPIPQHFIDDLLARADIVEIIGRRVPLKKAGREFQAFFSGTRRPMTSTISVRASSSSMKCWGMAPGMVQA